MPTLCPGCNLSVEPLKIFEKSPETLAWWVISRCPRERCAYNLDLEQYSGPTGKEDAKDSRRYPWRGEL